MINFKIPLLPPSVNHMLWTQRDLQILKEFYPQNGATATAKSLGRSRRSVISQASLRGIKQDRTSVFFKDWQSRAAKSKLGKKRPGQSLVMKSLWEDGKLKPPTQRVRDQTGLRMKRYLKENGHPKGMLGKTHSPEMRMEAAERGRRMWADPTSKVNSKAYRQGMSERSSLHMQARIKKGLPNVYSRCKWGRRSDLGNIFFRSSWEANYARYLNWMKGRGEIHAWEYESDTFWFEAIRRGVRSYTPDFKVWDKPDSSPYYQEVKGWMDGKSKTKLARMKKYFPAVRVDLIDKNVYVQIKKSLARVVPGWE